MTRTIKIASVQMDACPAATGERLARAEKLVAGAAAAGAQLVLLPELFNTGYGYSDDNYRRAEPMHGPTVAWLTRTATRQDVYLGGTLMLLDEDEVYNAFLLFAPDGRSWRYDKVYPWAWERAYYRDGRDITVADTDLGRIGLMVCWDVGHGDLWRRYAGRVDLMLISSCPPNVTDPTWHMPDGRQLTAGQINPLLGSMKGMAGHVFGSLINEQVAWLGVPAAQATTIGHFRSAIPNPAGTLLAMSPLAPGLLKHLPRAAEMEMSCGYVHESKILDANGQVMGKLSGLEGEAFTLAEVQLAGERPRPQRPQPPLGLPRFAYLMADYLIPWLTIPLYRAGLRQAQGPQMAPADPATSRWTAALAVGAGLAFVVGYLAGGRRRRRRKYS